MAGIYFPPWKILPGTVAQTKKKQCESIFNYTRLQFWGTSEVHWFFWSHSPRMLLLICF